MRTYVEVRKQGEALLREKGLDATRLRPWYVIGPGRRWPCLPLPAYAVLGWIPATRPGAQWQGLVVPAQMARALRRAVENPACGFGVVEVPKIRRA